MVELASLDRLSEVEPVKPEKDGRGLATDIPLQILGGVRDAAQETLSVLGLDKPSMYGRGLKLPEVDEADTTTGSLTRGGAQFATGFIPAFKLLNAGKTAKKIAEVAKKIGSSPKFATVFGIGVTSEMAAMLADQVVFDPYSGRLSNLIQEVPSLANPVTEYLASNPEDDAAEARFKVALEGAGLGLLVTPLIPIFRNLRAKGVRKNIDEAFDRARKEEQAKISKATDDIAKGVEPEEILRPTEQGQRPFVNNEYLETPEGIKNTINAVSNIFGETIDKARRGKMAVTETQNLADQMGMTVEELTKRKRGQAFNPEEALAARMLLTKSSDEVHRIAKVAANSDKNSDEAMLAFHKALAQNAAIQEQVMGVAAEAGRTLRSLQIPVGAPDRSRAIRSILESKDRVKDPDELVDMVSKLDTAEGIARFTRDLHKPTFKDRALEVWINSLLSGPTTQAVNILSNTAVAMWTVPETFLAATMGVFRKSDKVYFREVAARVAGMAQGAKDGIKLAARTFMTEEPSDMLTKIELNRPRSIPSFTLRQGAEKKVFGGVPIPFSGQIDIGGKQIRIPGRALQAGDEFFKAIGYRMELNAQAVRTGLDAGLSGKSLSRHIRKIVNDPPDNIKLTAHDTAHYQTFTNELGRFGKSLQTIAAHHAAARIVMPFIRTPINIVKFAGARSPVGFAMEPIQKQILAGGVQKDIAKSRIYMGSMVGVAMAHMAMEGHITGQGPKDPTLRSALYATGWQPYSIKIGDKYYAYSRLEPLGMILGVSADFAEIAQFAEEMEADDIAAATIFSVSKNLTSKTWLRGLSELIEALEDPDRYGQRYVQRMAGTLIPTGVAQYARTQDPVLRSANTVLDQIKSRIPNLSKELYPVRNVWGEPIELSGAAGPDIISPIYVSTIKNDPVAQEVARLNVSISRAERKIDGIQLTDQQYDSYVYASGTMAKQIVRQYILSDAWPELPDYKKKEIIKDTISRTRRVARTRLRVQLFPERIKNKIEEIKGVNQ
jgi:hypothetical protein